MPHFGEAAGILAAERDRLDALTRFLLARPPGAGPRALRRFAAGQPPSRWADALDRPRVRIEAARSRRHGET